MGTRQCVRFAEFSFNPVSGELFRNGTPVPLEHQPALVLAHLLASNGQLVTREDLRAVVWGGGTHVKFDDGLNYCIRQIRAALGDEARSPRFIETLPRRGYRFLTPVDVSRPAASWLRGSAAAAAIITALGVLPFAEMRPNRHHEVAISILRTVHDLIF